jgi:superfamily II DNA/RNA helicase
MWSGPPIAYPVRMSFADLGLSDKVLNAVTQAGYTTPTPIQAEAIPHVLARRDVLGIAQTGTGKTAAFTLPMITRLEQGRARARMPRTLILEPTRELAAQVEENFIKYGVDQKLSVALLIGGVSFGDQDAKITRGVDVLIATPGRLLDHFERGKLLLTGIEILVIDEADRMLDMGFIPDIERICKLTPFTRQTLFFTATMPSEIQRITGQFLSNPVKVEVSRPATAASTITQMLVASHGRDFEKRETLRNVLNKSEGLKNAIIFCNRKRDIDVVAKSLQKHGFSVGGLHGDMEQRARMATLDAFKNNNLQLLVASDVAARGLDIPDVSHVINYDVPIHADDYVHRIGRTGRAGRLGTSYTIVTSHDAKYLSAIESLLKLTIPFDGTSVDKLPPSTAVDSREGGRDSRSERGRGAERGGDRGRGDRGKPSHGRSRPVPERSSDPRDGGAATEAFVPDPNALATTPRAPAPKTAPKDVRNEPRQSAPRESRESKNEPRRNPAPAQAERSSAPPSRRYESRDDDSGPIVKGLGDHLPGFLARPIKRTGK